MKTRIALFDFDGTITRKDSLLVFIWYVKGPVRFVVGFTLLSPFLLAMKAGFMTNQRGKEIVLRYFFGGTPCLFSTVGVLSLQIPEFHPLSGLPHWMKSGDCKRTARKS